MCLLRSPFARHGRCPAAVDHSTDPTARPSTAQRSRAQRCAVLRSTPTCIHIGKLVDAECPAIIRAAKHHVAALGGKRLLLLLLLFAGVHFVIRTAVAALC